LYILHNLDVRKCGTCAPFSQRLHGTFRIGGGGELIGAFGFGDAATLAFELIGAIGFGDFTTFAFELIGAEGFGDCTTPSSTTSFF
jgi:hypothetical protein